MENWRQKRWPLKRYPFLSIALIEDDPELNLEMCNIFSEVFGQVFCATDGCEGFDLIETHKPDIILTDICMKCMDGFEMLRELKKANSAWFVLSGHDELHYLHTAIDLKVDGYFIKPLRLEEFFAKIDAHFSHLLDNDFSSLPHRNFSHREMEIFLDIVRGIKPSETAQRLGIKAKTVSTYRQRIIDKMGVDSNAELIRYAFMHDLL